MEYGKSIKNDRKDGKVRMDLLPWPELEKIAEVYTAGAAKYGDHNWENLEDVRHKIEDRYSAEGVCLVYEEEQ